MANEGVLVNGDYTIHARGAANMVSFGEGVQVHAMGSEGSLVASGEKAASLLSGPASVSVVAGEGTSGEVALVGGATGMIKQVAGAPVAPSQIVLSPEKLTLAFGVPGVGPSIELGPEGISMKYMAYSFELGATGAAFSVAGSSLKITPAGVNINGLNIEVQGQVAATIESVMTQLKASGVLEMQGTLAKIN